MGPFRPLDIDITKVKNHVHQMSSILQSHLNYYGIVVKPPEHDNEWLNAKIKESADDGDIVGQMHKEQVDAFVQLISVFLFRKSDNTWGFRKNHAAIEAATQSGKTGAINLIAGFLPTIINVLTGESVFITRWLIDDCSNETQTKEEAKYFEKLYGNITFNNVSPKRYMGALSANKNLELQDDVSSFGNCERTSLTKKQDFITQNKIFVKNKVKHIVICDESHARCDKQGVMHRTLSESCQDEDHWLEGGICFVGLSATNIALISAFEEYGYPVIVMYPGENYTGVPWLGGERLENVIVPTVLSFDDLAEYIAVSDMNPDEFQKAAFNFNTLSYVERTDWVLGIFYIIWHLHERFNSPGAIIRVPRNSIAEEVRKLLYDAHNDLAADKSNRLLPLKIVLHTEDNPRRGKKSLTLRDQINEECGKDRKDIMYVVITTARARMGSVLPKDCRNAIDFTADSKPQSLMQGLFGRETGYYKDVTCTVVSSVNATKLRFKIDTGEWDENPYPKHLYNSIRGANEPIEIHELSKQSQIAIRKFVAEHSYIKKHNGKLEARRSPKSKGCVFPVVFVEEAQNKRQKIKFALTPYQVVDNVKLCHCQIRLAIGGKETSNHDSLGDDRPFPVIVIDENMQPLTMRLRKSKDQKAQYSTKSKHFSHPSAINEKKKS